MRPALPVEERPPDLELRVLVRRRSGARRQQSAFGIEHEHEHEHEGRRTRDEDGKAILHSAIYILPSPVSPCAFAVTTPS